jgi:hypothetical protein
MGRPEKVTPGKKLDYETPGASQSKAPGHPLLGWIILIGIVLAVGAIMCVPQD